MLYRDKYRVESARYTQWNYAANGFYFVTICTKNRHHYFGEITGVETRMSLSKMGEIANRFWFEIPQQFSFVRLDEFVVMPNHVHGILEIAQPRRDAIYRVSPDLTNNTMDNAMNQDVMNRVSTGGATGVSNPMVGQDSLSSVIRWYKGRVAFESRQIESAVPFAWQTRFHDRIIRDESECNRIRQYVRDNLSNWLYDEENKPADNEKTP